MRNHNYNDNGRAGGGLAITPVLMILLGGVFLLNNFGVLPWEIWSNLWKFWPVLLILFGVEQLIGRNSSFKGLGVLLFLIFLVPIFLILNPFTGNPLATKGEGFTEPLANLTKGRLVFDFQSANLRLASLDSLSTDLFTGTIKYSNLLPKPSFTEEKKLGEGYYTFSQPSQKGLPFLNSLGNNIDFKLSRRVPLEIKTKTVSGVLNLDFSALKMEVAEIESATGQVNITFAKDFGGKVYIKTSAAIVNLTVPKEIAANIKTESTLKSINIDQTRFPQNAGNYRSHDYETNPYKLEVEISGQATNVNVK